MKSGLPSMNLQGPPTLTLKPMAERIRTHHACASSCPKPGKGSFLDLPRASAICASQLLPMATLEWLEPMQNQHVLELMCSPAAAAQAICLEASGQGVSRGQSKQTPHSSERAPRFQQLFRASTAYASYVSSPQTFGRSGKAAATRARHAHVTNTPHTCFSTPGQVPRASNPARTRPSQRCTCGGPSALLGP